MVQAGAFETEPAAMQFVPTPGPTKQAATLSLVGGFFAMLAIGTPYGWSVIGGNLTAYGYTDDQSRTIGTIGALSVYVTFHTGYFFDMYGVRPSLALGFVLVLTGWLLFLTGVRMGHHWIMLCLYQVLVGQAVQPIMCASLANVANFPPESRGTCGAIALTGFGMTSMVMAQAKVNLFPEDVISFMFFLAITAASMIAFQYVVFAPPAVTVPVPSATEARGGPSGLQHVLDLLAGQAGQFFLFGMLTFGMGLYYFVINLKDLAKSSNSPYAVGTLVTTFAFFNVVARPVTGFISDSVTLSRAQMFAIGLLIIALACGLLGLQCLMLGAIAMGIGDGFVFAIWVPLTREVHGGSNFGLTFSLYLGSIGVADVIANIILADLDILVPNAVVNIAGIPIFYSAMIYGLLAVVGAGAALMLHNNLLANPRAKSEGGFVAH